MPVDLKAHLPSRGAATTPTTPIISEETYSVAKFMPGIHRETVMLEGAELTAEREHISRAESDPWVLRSHKLAAQAAADGALSDIIVPCFGAVRDEAYAPK